MVYLVPFDNSPLSQAALARADTYAEAMDESVIALAVVPDDLEYVRDRGWIDPDESFDFKRIRRGLQVAVDTIAPEATLRCEQPKAGDERAALSTDISRTIRSVAAEIEPSVVFVGSEHAGTVTPPTESVGSPVFVDTRYDVHIVRHAES